MTVRRATVCDHQRKKDRQYVDDIGNRITKSMTFPMNIYIPGTSTAHSSGASFFLVVRLPPSDTKAECKIEARKFSSPER